MPSPSPDEVTILKVLVERLDDSGEDVEVLANSYLQDLARAHLHAGLKKLAERGIIHFPEGSVDAYRATVAWSPRGKARAEDILRAERMKALRKH